MDFYYSSTTLQNNTEYYNMSNAEYRKLTNHIITFATTMLERGVIDGKRESFANVTKRLDILREDRYSHKSTQHSEKISMLDAVCGIVSKINRRKNNDLTTRQVKMFNTIVRDFSKQVFGDSELLSKEIVNMQKISEQSTPQTTFGNGLFNVE